MSVKSCSAPPIVGLWMLSFTCWHSRSEFKCHCAHYFNSNLVFQPLAVPRLKNLCVKSSIGQLRLWTSGLLFSEEKMADYSLSSCMQHTQEWNSFQARRRQRESFSSGGSAMRLPVSTFGLAQQLLCFIQFFSSVSAARLIGISSNLFPNLNIPMKHRQIGGQSVRFTLHKRFSIAVWCLLLRQKNRWFQQSRDFSIGSGSTDVCQVSAGPTKASRLDPSLDCQNAHSELPLLISHTNATPYSVANCRLTVLLVPRISCAILMHWSKSVKSCDCDQRS